MAQTGRYLNVSVASDEDVRRRFLAAAAGEPQGEWLTFPTIERLWSTLSPERWAIVQAMVGGAGHSPVGIADRLNRSPDDVSRDLERLLYSGVIDLEDDLYVFDYDGIHVDFLIEAA